MSSARFSSKIIFVTGKGGVGKSTVAAALARKNALEGRKTLLVELGERSHFSSDPSWGEVTNTPKPTRMGFDLALWTGSSSLKEYVQHYVKVRALAELFFENKIMRSFLNVAPALNEIAVLGKITSAERGVGPPLRYDCIVVDTFATGHALALFRAPQGMAKAVSQGPMGAESRKIYEVLCQPDVVEYVLVSLPEELPVDESIELRDELSKIVPQKPTLVLNKVELSSWELEELKGLQSVSSVAVENQWASYLYRKKRYAEPILRRLDLEFPDRIEVPLIFTPELDRLINSVEESLSNR